jgi:intracellular sulfur oxidation DsrE/DsrF family protein
MTQEKRFSDEFLNAFVDDQLAAEEKGRAYLEIGQDEALNRQVCELRKLHDLVKLAYREVPAPPARTAAPTPRRRGRRAAVAAAVLLALGLALGSQIGAPPARAPLTTTTPAITVPRTVPVATPAQPAAVPIRRAMFVPVEPPAPTAPAAAAAPAVETPPALLAAAPSVAAREPASPEAKNKVLLHVAHDNVARLGQTLDEIEGLLRYYRDSRQSARVEVVINGRGLELVRVDTSAYAERIQRLQQEYDNLTFAACQNTIDRLRREQGIIVRLLPGVVTIDSGMAEISRRQHQGWTYLQV